MEEIKCPKCGEVFSIDEAKYASIVKQVRDKEFKKDIEEKINFEVSKVSSKKELEIQSLKNDMSLALNNALNEKEKEITKNILEVEKLKSELQVNKKDVEEKINLKVKTALSEKELEIQRLKNELQVNKKNNELNIANVIKQKENKIQELQNTIKLNNSEWELKQNSLKEEYRNTLKQKEDQIEYYKDLKAKQSTKMIGESLEKHCEIEFNKLRATAFQDTYFEKDNDIKTGTKGDYIYRETYDGVEYLSIMFEMKNEADNTEKKKKNEDFFAKLDKDRKEKNVSMLFLLAYLNLIMNTTIQV